MDAQQIIDAIKKRRDELHDRAGFASGFVGGDPAWLDSMVAEYDSLLTEIERFSKSPSPDKLTQSDTPFTRKPGLKALSARYGKNA
jgi:hypothetical protein